MLKRFEQEIGNVGVQKYGPGGFGVGIEHLCEPESIGIRDRTDHGRNQGIESDQTPLELTDSLCCFL